MEENKEFLGTEPVGRLLFKLAIPTVAAQIINLLYNIVDRIYIGHMPGDGSLALTGVGVCMPVILIISAFAALVSSGGAPRASIYMGKKDFDTAEKILGNCLSLLVIISVILTVLVLIFNREFLLLFGASENTIEYASSYMSVYALGTLFVQLTLGMNMFITAQGFAKTGMITVLIGALCNIALDPIFIFGLNMGVRGAALATIISQTISSIWCIAFLCGKKTRLIIKKENLKLEKSIILPCIALGAATFIMQASESVIAVCFNSSLLKYGGDVAVGAMTICTSLMQFTMLPMQGIGMGAQPISSYNFGAKNVDRVKEIFRLLLKICVIYSCAVYVLIMAFPNIFAAVFSNDASLIEYSTTVIRIYSAAMFIFGIQIACQLTFVSIGNAACSIIVAVVRKFVLLIPLIYIMPVFISNKTFGVYMAEPVADFTAVIFTSVLFSVQFRKALRGISDYNNYSIETKDLILRKARFEDWNDIYTNLWRHEESARYMMWSVTNSEDEAIDRINRTLAFQKENKYTFFAVERKSNIVIGFAGMKEIEPGVFDDMGIGLGPEYTGKGYGTQILNALLNEAKANGGHKFIASCWKQNIASKKLQDRLGFQFIKEEVRVDQRTGEDYTLVVNEKILK